MKIDLISYFGRICGSVCRLVAKKSLFNELAFKGLIYFRSFLIPLCRTIGKKRNIKNYFASFWFQSRSYFLLHLETFSADELSSFNAINIYLDVSRVRWKDEGVKRWNEFKPLSWRQPTQKGRTLKGIKNRIEPELVYRILWVGQKTKIEYFNTLDIIFLDCQKLQIFNLYFSECTNKCFLLSN